jgi:glycosyltransferase involved in cell wall biosynthesis
MHVVVIADHAYVNGGQAKVAIDSAIGLAGRGHRVTYFAACGPIDERLTDSGVEIVCLGQPDITTAGSQLAFLAQTMWNAKAARRLADVLAGLDPAVTVLHVHAWAKALSPSIGPVISRAGLAAVYTMHEFFLVCPTGGFYDYNRAEPCRRVPLSFSCVTCNCDARSYPRKVLRMIRQLLLDDVSRLKQTIRHVVTISELQYQVVRDYLPPQTIYHRVGNPISVPDLGPKPAPGGEFLFVGRLSAEKGVAHFCAAARLAGVAPVIAGDGPLADELRMRFPEARMLGWQSRDRVCELMRAARALVFPSVWYEGQPLTVYEALALGTPVIVSDVCAGREAVEDGVNGAWFSSADPHSLAAAIERLGDDTTAARMSRRAYETYWADPLTIDRHLDAIEAVYGEALGEVGTQPEAGATAGRAKCAPSGNELIAGSMPPDRRRSCSSRRPTSPAAEARRTPPDACPGP